LSICNVDKQRWLKLDALNLRTLCRILAIGEVGSLKLSGVCDPLTNNACNEWFLVLVLLLLRHCWLGDRQGSACKNPVQSILKGLVPEEVEERSWWKQVCAESSH